jgi:long-chain fatty acid transport protein
MRDSQLPVRFLTLTAALLAPGLSHATNGYFSHGYGAASEGTAGVGIALPQDALAAATNPAGTVAVGNRLDLGLDAFAPRRGASITGNAFGADASYSGDASKTFFIPNFGYARQLNATTAIGLAVYGNGGMNTDYASNPYARFGATGSAGVNLEQLFITPSVAYKLGENHSVGVALNLAYQRFSAKGVGFFAGFSSAPANVSDQGTDSSTGAGVRLGWSGKLTPTLTLGATWASKISGKFKKYKGLFADGGGFDIPENYGLGLALAATPDLTLAADVQTIRYSQVGSVGDSVASLFAGTPLGASHGPGFGWKDSTVFKLAAVQRVRSDLVLRVGVSVANEVVPASQTFFNILAPGVVKNHLTLGGTWSATKGGELTGFFAHGFGQTVNGVNSIPPGAPSAGGFGGGNANVHLQENIIGVSYGWKL